MRRIRRLAALLSLLVLANAMPAYAQFGLPPVPGPALPSFDRQLGVDDALRGVSRRPDAALDARSKALRKLRIRGLRHTYGRQIDVDPAGEPVVRGELVALSPSPVVLARARVAGFRVLRQRALGRLGIDVAVLSAPDGQSTRQALGRLRSLDPDGVFDFNHIYLDAGTVRVSSGGGAAPSTPPAPPSDLAALADPHAPASGGIGLIDGGVDGTAALLREVRLQSWGCAGKAAPSAHGTAVASLLVGRGHGFRSAAAGLALYAANVYCGDARDGSIDRVADAFVWLDAAGVTVVNVSLVGPPNRLLAQLVRSTLARGRIVVAAVGNDGPAAPALYPAAYPGVVAVTAVDTRRRVLPEAGRGPHVLFAAPGSDMVAASGAGYAAVRGTSFAAPIVAGLLAAGLAGQPNLNARQALDALATSVVDLGTPGRDPVFGLGLVGEALRTRGDRSPGLGRAR